jgi:hypothetical protein
MLSETSSATVAREYAGLRTMDGGRYGLGCSRLAARNVPPGGSAWTSGGNWTRTTAFQPASTEPGPG